MSFRLMSVAGCVLALLVPARALAQNPVEDGASTARIRVGPFGMTPRFTIHDLGVDSNVNRVAGGKKAFTLTLEPILDSWLHVGAARFAGKTAGQWIMFGQRAPGTTGPAAPPSTFGRTQSVTGSYQFARFAPYAGVSYVRTQRSTSVEIDNSVPQTTTTRRIGVTTALFTALSLDLDAVSTGFGLDRSNASEATFADALNRRTRETTLTMRYTATPMTTVVVKTGLQQDRFTGSSLRDSNTLTVSPGVEFKPYALMAGTVFVGYRRFNALDPSVPDYAGVTAAVSLTFMASEMTKVGVDVRRDVDYSYELTQPYFLSTSAGVSVTQMLGTSWDAVARLGHTRMAYRSVTTVLAAGRNDQLQTWGAGLGRHLSNGIRVGFDVDYMKRTSVVDGRGFHGFRFGGSVTYGS